MQRLLIAIAAALASLIFAAPASAQITLDDYNSLQAGDTKHHVETLIDDVGCRVGPTSLHNGKYWQRKIYKMEGNNPAWVIIVYSKDDADSSWLLVSKSVTNDLQLSGITSYTCP